MVRKLVAITDDADLQVTLPPGFNASYVRSLVEQHVGAEAAATLSEPRAVPGEGRRQWLTEANFDEVPVRLDKAGARAAIAGEKLLRTREQVLKAYEALNSGGEASKQQAIAVLRAFELPKDAEYVWVFGDRPVLVGWGHVGARVVPLDSVALALTFRRKAPSEPNEPTNVDPAANSPAVEEPFVEPTTANSKSPARRWLTPFLWLLFVGLVSAIGLQLWWACSIGLPGISERWSWRSACVSSFDDPLAMLIKHFHELQDELQSLQTSLVSREQCEGPRVGDVNAPVQVTLDWNTADDLDLVIECPSGMISNLKEHKNRAGNCGDGTLDKDANYRMINWDHPTAEHVRWYHMPRGPYRVYVMPSRVRTPDPITFRVRLDLYGKTLTCPGDVAWNGAAGHGQYVIDFNPTQSLPACKKENHPLHLCALNDPNCGKD
jgi:hypothetical protein